jgi:hypothetical protein
LNVGSGTIYGATFSGNALTASLATNASNLIGSPSISVSSITTQNNTLNVGSATIYAGTIGIGTTSPQSNLDLWGTFGVTIGNQKQFSVTSNQTTFGLDTLTLPFINSTTLTTSALTATTISSGSVISTSITTQNNPINAGSGTLYAGITTLAAITTQNNTINAGSAIIYAGTVGIGTSTPQSNLDLWGNMGVSFNTSYGVQKQFTVTSNQVGMIADTLTIPFISTSTLQASTIVASNIILSSTSSTQNNAMNLGSGQLTGGIVVVGTSPLISTYTPSAQGNIYASDTISSANPMMFRNRLHNGAMNIWQRGSNITSNMTGGQYANADRWCSGTGASNITFAQSYIVPNTAGAYGFSNSLQVISSNVTTIPLIEQRIESVNIQDLVSGTPVTLSFWAQQTSNTLVSLVANLWVPASGSPNNFASGLVQTGGGGTGLSPSSFGTISTWYYFTTTFTLTTAGSLTTTQNNGLAIRIGTTSVATGGTFLFTGIQLEKGSTASPFEFRPYSVELALCQRYYYQWTSTLPANLPSGTTTSLSIVGTGVATTTSALWVPLTIPVPMRTQNITFTYSSAVGTSNFQTLPGSLLLTPSLQADAQTSTSVTLNLTGSGLTAGSSYIVRTSNIALQSYLGFSADL